MFRNALQVLCSQLLKLEEVAHELPGAVEARPKVTEAMQAEGLLQ
jgi:hypothetical protein